MQGLRYWAYVGCRTTRERQARGLGLQVYAVDAAGGWVHVQQVASRPNPSYLCLHPGGNHLYAVHGDLSELSHYRLQPETGTLALVATWPTAGRNPVHLAPSPSGRWLLVANYASGNVAVLPMDTQGQSGPLGQAAHSLALPGEPGPHRGQQHGAHPHQLVFDPSGCWLLVADKGLDRVFTLVQDDATGELRVASACAFRAGSGPRHLVFHPAHPWVYLVCELEATLVFCQFDATTGALHPRQVLSTVPENCTGARTAAAIVMDPGGAWVCVSNRGHDSLAHFVIDPFSGRLAGASHTGCGGRTPRFMTTMPGAAGLLVANEDSDSLVRLDTTQPGQPPQRLAGTGSPVCVIFRKAE